MKKRLLSSLLTVLIIAMSVPQLALASSGAVVHTFDVTADALVKGDDASVAFGTTTDTALKNNVMYTTNGSSSKRYMYYAFDLSAFGVPEGHAVTSAKLKLSLSSSSQTMVSDMAFWYVDTSAAMWKEDTITFGTQPLSVATEGADNMKKLPENTPDLMYDFEIESTFDQSSCGDTNPTAFSTYEFEIVPMIRKYLASGNTSEFSFAMSPVSTSGNAFTYVVTKERYDTIKLTAPTAIKTVLEVTTEPLAPLAVTSATPTDGAYGVSAADDIVINFNNPINASSVAASDITITHDNGTVALAASDITVSDTSITISKDLEKYTYYTFSIADVNDVYGQPLNTPYSFIFETGSAVAPSTSLIPVAGNIEIDYVGSWTPTQYRLNRSGQNAEPSDTPNVFKTKGRYVLVKLDISGVDADKALRDVIFSYTKISSGMLRNASVHIVPNGDNGWLKASDFTGSSNSADSAAFSTRQTALETYYNSVTAAMTESNLLDICNIDNAANTTRTVDITSAVLAAKERGEDYITLCITGNDTKDIGSKDHSAYPFKVSAVQEEASYAVISSAPAKHGAMSGVSDPIELNLATNISNSAASDYIRLTKADGTTVPATVSASDNRITITPSSDLEAYSEYKVIFKAGLTDIYTNTVSTDTVALVFNSGTPLSVAPVKFTSDSNAVYDSLTPLPSYSAGDSVSVVAAVTNSSEASHGAVIIAALYDAVSHKRLGTEITTMSVPSGGTSVQISATIDVPSSADGTYIKAFLWDGADTIRPLCSEFAINQN